MKIITESPLTKILEMGNGREKKYPTRTHEIINVTPGMAKKFLSNNNPPIVIKSSEQYAHYVEQMRKGLWDITNDDICLDWYGNLLNGQRRLSAVIAYGKPVKMSIKFGVEPTTFAIMDCGKIKTDGNALEKGGFKYGDKKAAIIKSYLKFKSNKLFCANKDKKLQPDDILNYANANIERLQEVYLCTKKIFKEFRGIPFKYLGGFYWKVSDINKEVANDFFEKYKTGATSAGFVLQKRHPVYVLRKQLMNDATSSKHCPFPEKILWFFIAWNLYREGKSISNFKTNYKKGDSFPKLI